MPVIKIDDAEYEVAAGQNLIQAAASVGIEIPHYCYHPGLSVSAIAVCVWSKSKARAA